MSTLSDAFTSGLNPVIVENIQVAISAGLMIGGILLAVSLGWRLYRSFLDDRETDRMNQGWQDDDDYAMNNDHLDIDNDFTPSIQCAYCGQDVEAVDGYSLDDALEEHLDECDDFIDQGGRYS